MPYKMDMEAFSKIISDNPVIKGLISDILGEDAVVINKSLIISNSGSKVCILFIFRLYYYQYYSYFYIMHIIIRIKVGM
jgi:hypothetical protein